VADIRVVLDANVLVSGLAYPKGIPGQIVNAWLTGSLAVVLSRYILDEMVRVLPRVPANRRTPEEIRDLAEGFLGLAQVVVPDSEIEPALRDPGDQQILGTLRASRADYLITGDKDLLALADRYPILTPAAFWTRHGS
jgi:putative PIN family toxin of toxin-antitoxin system